MENIRLSFSSLIPPAPFVARTLALACALGLGSATASPEFGALSNFDVFNDTGEDAHGFEIELEGVSASDVLYTFGGGYSHYGSPSVETDASGKVFVRYKAAYNPGNNTWVGTTVRAPAVITPTNGHACFNGGMNPAAYDASGCEHFGVSLRGNATRTAYRWLVADPGNPGNLVPSGTQVSLPAPVWTPPPANPAQPQVVAAVVQPEPAEVHDQWGKAQWVKVYVTESEQPAQLDHLLTDDPAVPQEAAETETEWVLMQARPANDPGEDELAEQKELGKGKESVTRRYEFYEYTGAYDPENHEAIPRNDADPYANADGSAAPQGNGDIGNYIGAQMVAFNLDADAALPLSLSAGLPLGEVGVPYRAPLVTGGMPGYSFAFAKKNGAWPDGLAADPASGALYGVPAQAKKYKLSFTAADSAAPSASVSGSLVLQIAKPVAITTSVLPPAKLKKGVPAFYSAKLKAKLGAAPYAWALVAGGLPNGVDLDGGTGRISGIPTEHGNFAFTVEVGDGLGGTARQDLTLVVP